MRDVSVILFALTWFAAFFGCHGREVVVCTTGDHTGYAAQSSLFEFEEHALRTVWFEAASRIPSPTSGECDIVRLPSHLVMSLIARGVPLQAHTVRMQMRELVQLVARPHIQAPNHLVGKSIAVTVATEMHVAALKAIEVFSLPYREVSRTEFLEGGLGPSALAVTIVLCDVNAEVDALYKAEAVDAKMVSHAASSEVINPSEVMLTTEELYGWGHSISLITATTREWAQDPVNLRILQYYTAVTEVHDAHFGKQAFDSSSPDIRFVVTALFGMRGVPVVAGQVQGLPPFALNARYESLAFHLPKYFIFPSGEFFWEEHMNLMASDSILRELADKSAMFYRLGLSTRLVSVEEVGQHMGSKLYQSGDDGEDGEFVKMVRLVQDSFNWTLGQSPGEQRPPRDLGAWDNWPSPQQSQVCSGTTNVTNASGQFSDGHLAQGQYATSAACDWHFPLNETVTAPVLLEFPFFNLDSTSDTDAVRVFDPSAPHRLLALFRGQVAGLGVRHAGALTVHFRSDAIRRLNMLDREMGFLANYSRSGCGEDPRGCGAGTCGADGVCACPEGHAGVDCGLQHCLGTNVHRPAAGESVRLVSNAAATYAPHADCRWEVHPPADCTTCVVDLVFVAMQVELGHDSVQVAAAPSSAAFWWEDPPSNTIVRTRADLNTSGLRVRGAPGEAVFVRLLSDEIVEMHGFVAVATVMDARDAPGPGGASTSNCYDGQGEEACSARGVCVPGGGDTENELGECVCEEGYFGPTCREEVCDDVNIAPTRPLWNLGGTSGERLIARNAECAWRVSPSPLTTTSTTLAVRSVRVHVRAWRFDNPRDSELALEADSLLVAIQHNQCLAGQECALDSQCTSMENGMAGRCAWLVRGETLEMPPQFTLRLRSGMNTLHPNISIVIQATFLAPSGHVVLVASDAALPVCEPHPNDNAPLVFSFEAMDCLMGKEISAESNSTASSSSDDDDDDTMFLLSIVLTPILSVLVLMGLLLMYRNHLLAHDLADMRSQSAKLNPPARTHDLDSPLTKVTTYLGKIAKKKSWIARLLNLKDDELVQQAHELQAMLLESDNVHKPQLDAQRLEQDYGQDIVRFLLASTRISRFERQDSSQECARAGTNAHNGSCDSGSDNESADPSNPAPSSVNSSNELREMPEEDQAMLFEAGRSYAIDFSHVYVLQLSGALCFVGMKVLEDWDLFKCLDISYSKMTSFLLAVEKGYRDNPYHNVYHAADVTNRLATMLHYSGLAAHLRESRKGRIQLLGVVLAAAVHDYEHPGTNNAYAVNTGQLYAKIYNDQAVYENSALYQALSMTDNHELDFSTRFSAEAKRLLRVTIIDLVLATDMSRHFDMVGLVKSKMDLSINEATSRNSSKLLDSTSLGLVKRKESVECFQQPEGIDLTGLSSEQMLLVLQFGLKVADIGHCMLPVDQHKFWVAHLETEFFSQGDLEKEAGLPISPLMDRTKPGPTNGGNQAGFFEVIVMPTITLWQALFPGSADLLHQQALSNLNFWKRSGLPEEQAHDDLALDIRQMSLKVQKNGGSILKRQRRDSYH